MEETKRALIRKRAIAKGMLTSQEKIINDFQILTGEHFELLKLRETKCEDVYRQYNEAQTAIENIVEDFETELVERNEFEDRYFDLIAKIKMMCNQYMKGNATNVNNSVSNDGFNNVFAVNNAPMNHIKLPEIQIPSFSGDFADWLSFRDSFKAIVIDNHSLSDVVKFYYLNSSLNGEAKQLLKNITVSEENFMVAWNLLTTRYNNVRLIAHNHLSKLFKPPEFKGDSLSLRSIIDHFVSHVNALEALDLNGVSLQDLFLSHFILDLLDPDSIREWENFIEVNKIPNLQDLVSFLERKCKVLEITDDDKKPLSKTPVVKPSTSEQAPQMTKHVTKQLQCLYCNRSNHTLARCNIFLRLATSAKWDFVRNKKLCNNCLCLYEPGHSCSKNSCSKCSRKHHTLLHYDTSPNNNDQSSRAHANVVNSTSATTSSNVQASKSLLPTAKLYITASNGKRLPVTALLDSASDCNLISAQLIKRLGVQGKPVNVQISGVNQIQDTANTSAEILISASATQWSTKLTCLVVPSIALNLPLTSFDVKDWNIPPNILIADPEFNISKPIDLVLGAEFFFDLLQPGKITPTNNVPIIQNTSLGWVFSGKLPEMNMSQPKHVVSALTISYPQVEQQLEAFWRIEEIDTPVLSPEEALCEEHFAANTKRLDNGRFVVRLPRKPEAEPLGASRFTTLNRFNSLERRLSRCPELSREYVEFMEQYIALGHMQIAPEHTCSETYYIPHHPVFKPHSTSTKLRVVFDASAVTTSGQSLNDTLLVGPVVQQDLFSILIRFRTHTVTWAADLSKMYRQILIDPRDRNLQRIFWRKSPSEPLLEYQLNTVTYGTSPASFLATRVLKELALTDGMKFPDAAQIVLNDFYIDDCISGCDSVQKAIALYKQLTELLHAGGFELLKWSTNSQELLNVIPIEHREKLELRTFDDGEGNIARTLGLYWQSECDLLRIQSPIVKCDSSIIFTKRTFLSIVSSIFDPLGLVSPVVIACKVLFQNVWIHKLKWDDPLPDDIKYPWLDIYHNLPAISEIALPRLIKPKTNIKYMQLHGFCDSSQQAYGACLYLLTVDENDEVTVMLICAKSKVAPLKQLSIPRLELCSALLLAKLLNKVQPILHLSISKVYLWSDSTIVLSWLMSPSYKWKIFVANRVAAIQRLTSHCIWKHVSSKDNPADLISRGCTPNELRNNSLWWSGPKWLRSLTFANESNNANIPASKLPEFKIACATTMKHPELNILDNCSSYTKLIRIIAFCLRFISNCKNPERIIGSITANEFDTAVITCVKIVQAQSYPNELAALAVGEQVPLNSSIKNLFPILHTDGTIRVGGRLQLSNLPFDTKHQMILSHDHNFTKILTKYMHLKTLHGNAQVIIATIRQRFWIPSLRKLVRSIIRACTICIRFNARPAQQLMGQLPTYRLQQTFPFNHVGVDYCGPFAIKFGGPRSKITCKAYVALFICMTTRAIHTEVVTSLSSQAFIEAFTRFYSRRGVPAHVYSDNGTNFQGAQTELALLLRSSDFQSAVQDSSASLSIQWHFIPPSSPHFGGLWEANIKCLKSHLIRVVKNQILTYVELTTLIVQIEAVLNSRPISPMTEDPTDLCYLSPGHFLVGRPLNALPVPDTTELPANRLSRWQLLQQILTSVWRKWSTDHLLALQQRNKWNRMSPNLKVGTLVLIMDNNIPPSKWRMARILEVFRGKDNLARVVSLHTSSGLVKRPIVKICPLLPTD